MSSIDETQQTLGLPIELSQPEVLGSEVIVYSYHENSEIENCYLRSFSGWSSDFIIHQILILYYYVNESNDSNL
jgi:hypothetical protein